jgi:hypothetical protein
MTKRKSKPTKPKATPDELLEKSPTTGYEPRGHFGNFVFYGQSRPPFTQQTLAGMLTDPRVIYGLWLLKGPILSDAHVKVDCDDETIRQFVVDQINRFWANSAVKALKAVEWGYSGSEVLYREKDGLVHFDELRDFDSPDCTVILHEGNAVGLKIRNTTADGPPENPEVYLGFPKAMLQTHWRERRRWYGLSRLYGAHIPWWETWGDGGYRDIRRLWFYKNAFDGGTIRHPGGASPDDSGTLRPNRDIARELIEKKRAGGVLTLPNTPAGETGQYAWVYEPAAPMPVPEGLMEYGETLRNEILEALGIPPEIIQSSGDQGFGSSTGRQVPQTAFYCIIQELLQWLVFDLDYCVLKPLVEVNFGLGSATYELQPFKLSEKMEQEGSNLSADNFNGNQFQDENQRSEGMNGVPMSHPQKFDLNVARLTNLNGKPYHFRQSGRWWTAQHGLIRPMATAV